MSNRSRLVIVGGGPAGLSSAGEASKWGMQVTIVEKNASLGGQYFRGRKTSKVEGSPEWFARNSDGVRTLLDSVVFDAPSDGVLMLWKEGQGVQSFSYDALVLATGAYDRPIALPGWTLPGVLTVGGA